MDGPLFSLYRAQVAGIDPASGTATVGLYWGGNSLTLGHVIVAGNATTGLHWMPAVGDLVLIQYEPGLVAQIICPLSDVSQAAGLSPPLAAGEVRVSGPLSITGVLTVQGNGIIETDGVIGGGAPGAATHYLRVTMDGVTWYRIALTDD